VVGEGMPMIYNGQEAGMRHWHRQSQIPLQN